MWRIADALQLFGSAHSETMFLLCLVLQVDLAAARKTSLGLAPFGIKTYAVSTLGMAQRMLSQWRFDIILVEGSGFGDAVTDLLVQLAKSQVPIMLATDERDEAALIRYLESGATEVFADGLLSPLTARRLSRLASLRRDHLQIPVGEIRRGPLVLDPHRMTVLVGDQPLQLTPHLFQALLLLVSNAGQFVHRQTLAGLVRRAGPGTRCVDMTISRLRRLLREFEPSGVSIQTVLGRGYCLHVEDQSSPSALTWAA